MSDQKYPWSGGEIKGYFYWQGNFIGGSSSPTTQYFAGYVSAPQEPYQDQDNPGVSNIVQAQAQFNYYGNNFPDDLNAIFLFSGYSNAAKALSAVVNYTTNTNMYTNAAQYFIDQGLNVGSGEALLGICFGGGNENGAWNTGESGAVYSIYQAVTQEGCPFSYKETGTGQTLSGIGSGILNDDYNCLVFDIEEWTGPSGSTAEDFLNLFHYIKTDSNSNYAFFETQQDVKIIVTIAHSCSNYNTSVAQTAIDSGQSVCSGLYEASGWDPCPYDYISPQMYTQNCGTTNEYCANYNIYWKTGYVGLPLFVTLISSNSNFRDYGVNFILPAINLGNLYKTGGTNDLNPSNLYFWQSSSNTNPVLTESASGNAILPYPVDSGVVGFFNGIFETDNPNLGGYAQWVNGTLDNIMFGVTLAKKKKFSEIVMHKKISKKCRDCLS